MLRAHQGADRDRRRWVHVRLHHDLRSMFDGPCKPPRRAFEAPSKASPPSATRAKPPKSLSAAHSACSLKVRGSGADTVRQSRRRFLKGRTLIFCFSKKCETHFPNSEKQPAYKSSLGNEAGIVFARCDKKGVPPPPSTAAVGGFRIGEGRTREIGRRAFLGMVAGGIAAAVTGLARVLPPMVSKVPREVFEYARVRQQLMELVSGARPELFGTSISAVSQPHRGRSDAPVGS